MHSRKAPTYIKQIPADLKEEIDSKITVWDFNVSLSLMDTPSRQKISKETLALNNTLDQTDLRDIYRTFHQKQQNENHNETPPPISQNGYYETKSTNALCGRGCEREETLVHCWSHCVLVQPLWQRVWAFLKELRMIYICPSNSTAGYLSLKNTNLKRPTVALFTTATRWKQLKCPSIDEKNKDVCVYQSVYLYNWI